MFIGNLPACLKHVKKVYGAHSPKHDLPAIAVCCPPRCLGFIETDKTGVPPR